jgi:DNA-binding XRE family transcriptional regulator
MNEILWHDRARKQLKKIPAHYREATHEHVDKLNVFPEHHGLDIIWFPNDVVKATSCGDSLIKAWREHFGLSQAELAAKAGISESILIELESNAVSPKKTDLAKLAKAMDIDKKQLID